MIAGIIAEYNPFHSGHAYQISEVRKFFHDVEIVALMSGSFTQRGTPAILDKWTRARLAIEGGCDLVLELPFTSAVRSAQDFARGGVKLLSELGIIDKIIFGAEFSDLQKLQTAANVFDDKNFHDKLKIKMSAGISYAAAVTKILSGVAEIDEKILRQPNTILAVEYLRALPSFIEPILIQRVGAGYDDLNLQRFSSAAAIRTAVYKKNPEWKKFSESVNKKVLDELQAEKNRGLVREDFLFRPIVTKIFTSNIDDLKKIYGMSEGLENRLIESAKKAKNFSELVSGIVSRRYQTSRIKRLLLYFLLNLTEEKIFATQSENFVRVLAFNERGQKLLKKIRRVSKLPIVNKVSHHFKIKNFEPYKKNLMIDIAATNLRGILFEVPKTYNQDFLTSPQVFR